MGHDAPDTSDGTREWREVAMDCKRGKDPFRNDEGGFTTLSVAVSLLLVIVLLFGAAQVRWAQSESPDIQFVADSAALAAENVVAEYYTVARVADAVVLSMSMLSLTMYGISIVMCVVPATTSVGVSLMKAADSVSAGRDKLAESATNALDAIQAALPLACMANATAVIEQNGEEYGYIGTAIPFPTTGESVSIGTDDADEMVDDLVESNAEAAESIMEVEEYTELMDEAKETAYEADCGSYPSICMYERASKLAGLSGSSNAYYSSVEYWSFSVALDRAKRYYAARLANEEPEGSSIDEKVNSECRRVYYEYAVEVMAEGYVEEGDDGFSAYFPTLPVNTAEMKQTHMYTDRSWWVSSDGVIHGSSECSAYVAAGAAGKGSLSQLDDGTYSECEVCGLKSSSLGKVGSATSHIGNGFEYYYRIVAEQAELYEDYSAKAAEAEAAAKESAGESLISFEDALEEISAADTRYDPMPPGRYGCIAVVVDTSSHDAPSLLQSDLLDSDAAIGSRIAISAAALAEEESEDGDNLISSMLDGIYEDTVEDGGSGLLVGGFDWILDLWGSALSFYSEGVETISDGIEGVIDSIPTIGETELGSWAKGALLEVLDVAGVQPAELSSPKPLVVNTSHVLDQANGTLGSVLSNARSILSTGQMAEDIEIEILDGVSIDIELPEDIEVPEELFDYLDEILGET